MVFDTPLTNIVPRCLILKFYIYFTISPRLNSLILNSRSITLGDTVYVSCCFITYTHKLINLVRISAVVFTLSSLITTHLDTITFLYTITTHCCLAGVSRVYNTLCWVISSYSCHKSRLHQDTFISFDFFLCQKSQSTGKRQTRINCFPCDL